jgi:membrane protease YdiL (CAAX protease family)
MFTGAEAKPSAALDVSGLSAASDSPRLDAPDQQPAKGPRWVKGFRDDGNKPASSLKRTLSVGFLGAVIPLALTMAAVTVAQLLGYHLHPNYQGPSGAETTSLVQALAIWVGAAVMAPVSEEAIFRGGIQGRLAKLSQKLHLGNFVLPALITSVIFVALHETSDPVLFGTRLVHAMILSYVYHKDGILASMAAHGFFNGLLAVSIVAGALGMPWLGLATLPLSIWGVLKARKILKSQKPDIASGALAPKPMTAQMAFAFAALLMAGYFFIMPNIFWPLGAIALAWAGARKLKNK